MGGIGLSSTEPQPNTQHTCTHIHIRNHTYIYLHTPANIYMHRQNKTHIHLHTERTHTDKHIYAQNKRYNNMQHIEDNREQDTIQNTENSTQAQHTEQCTQLSYI